MEVKKYVKSTIENVTWADVAQIMDHSNMIGGYEDFLRDHGLAPGNVVPMATHSFGGRHWKLQEGAKPIFFEHYEEDWGRKEGWYVLREEDVKYLWCQSYTSGSTLTAELEPRGFWTVTLEVPVGDDGMPYNGVYATSFERVALRLGDDDERWEALAEAYDACHGEFAWQDHEPEEVIALPEGLDGPWGWEAIASSAGFTAWRRPVNAQV